MKAIGGYFELELRKEADYHPAAIALNSARHCFEYILRARGYRKVYLPYYTCEVMLQPLQRLGLTWEFYHINTDLEPLALPELAENEAFVYTNYFGLKQACMESLARHYGNRLIADNAQAFYAPRIPGIDTFYSPRKFFGVPDGGYLYTDCLQEEVQEQDVSYARMEHLLRRIDDGAEAGYNAFRKSSEELSTAPIRRMSRLTQCILANVDYEEARQKRCANYALLQSALQSTNELTLCADESSVPLVYPYLTSDTSIRNELISQRIYVASYWPNVPKWCADTALENRLATQLVNLPVDQRYGNVEMRQILTTLMKQSPLTI